jgi:hypothetical protein
MGTQQILVAYCIREDLEHAMACKDTYLHFLIPDVLRFERNGLFHGNQAKNLQLVDKW